MVAATAEELSRRRRIPSRAENRTATCFLRNFSFPPTLSWRNQRHLRCVNLTSANHTVGHHADVEATSPHRTWNLRSRRSNPNRIASNPNPKLNSDFDRSLLPSPPSPTILIAEKGKRFESEEENNDKGKRCNFAIGLKREEIEDDFMRMKGSKPPRRPKKRAKCIQKQLDTLFPGFWLSEITPELYKVKVDVEI